MPLAHKKAAVSGGFLLCAAKPRRLFQLGRDARELGVQRGAEAVDDRDDRDRDAGGDKAVFDGGGARIVPQETRKEVLHW